MEGKSKQIWKEDFEMEFQKDSVYLLEARMEEEQKYIESLKPVDEAKIVAEELTQEEINIKPKEEVFGEYKLPF